MLCEQCEKHVTGPDELRVQMVRPMSCCRLLGISEVTAEMFFRIAGDACFCVKFENVGVRAVASCG